ncbi:hypothetical protein LEP1GSC125_3403 [Leptospira mayottensis 200901122]|uniref:Uncharacterized protein n=1 Tax=Leptospira mayottensis 200901122 TaxID=1193010 RepID=A0AA87SY89_9LEPT|nr:hypothetical protein LEP1GSC125_3403 [Leptospira mayottensis 200901122]
MDPFLSKTFLRLHATFWFDLRSVFIGNLARILFLEKAIDSQNYLSKKLENP